jgi:hypothetical protein
MTATTKTRQIMRSTTKSRPTALPRLLVLGDQSHVRSLLHSTTAIKTLEAKDPRQTFYPINEDSFKAVSKLIVEASEGKKKLIEVVVNRKEKCEAKGIQGSMSKADEAKDEDVMKEGPISTTCS